MSSPSPQLEDGYTRIANELLEALARIRIPGEAYQVLNVILRKTYGYQKKEDRIALAQFSEATGLKRQHVARSLKKLTELNVVTVTNNGATAPATYRINKLSATWIHAPKKVQDDGTKNGYSDGTKNGAPLSPNMVRTVTKNGADLSPFSGPSKEIERNERNKEKTTTTTAAALTVREVSILYQKYAGMNVTSGGLVTVFQDIAKGFTADAINEAFQAAAAAGIESRHFIRWAISRMERRQVVQQQEAQQQDEKKRQLADVEIGSQFRSLVTGKLFEVLDQFGAVVTVLDIDEGEQINMDKSRLNDPEKFEKVDA